MVGTDKQYVYTEMIKHQNKMLDTFCKYNKEAHRFDITTRFCIYCNIAQYEQHCNPTPCKRIMEPFDISE